MKAESSKERIARCEAAVAAQPSSAAAHFNLALAYTDRGMIRRAEEEYRKALDLNPDLVEAWVNLGGVLLLQWDFKGTLEATRNAVNRNGDTLLAHYNMGQAFLYLGDAEGVVSCYRRVLSLDPDHPGGHYYLAVGLLALGNQAESQEHLATAIRLGFRPQPDFLRALEKADRNRPAVPVMEIEGKRE